MAESRSRRVPGAVRSRPPITRPPGSREFVDELLHDLARAWYRPRAWGAMLGDAVPARDGQRHQRLCSQRAGMQMTADRGTCVLIGTPASSGRSDQLGNGSTGPKARGAPSCCSDPSLTPSGPASRTTSNCRACAPSGAPSPFPPPGLRAAQGMRPTAPKLHATRRRQRGGRRCPTGRSRPES